VTYGFRDRRTVHESVLSRAADPLAIREGVKATIGWRATRCDLMSSKPTTSMRENSYIYSDFFKPSGGLEPPTPSLP
jgi:hypothetical protein